MPDLLTEIRERLADWVRERLPRRRQRTLLPVAALTGADALIKRFIDGGCIPWSTGYGEYRLQYVTQILSDRALMATFRTAGPLPPGHGYRLDERVVEYAWVLSRSADWGHRVLDAGSTLNYPALFDRPELSVRQIIVYNLIHDWKARRASVSYVVGDLRRMCIKTESIDVVVCISTLEHIGLDHSRFQEDSRYQENRPKDYMTVLHEFRRILTPRGRLLVTVPFGKPTIGEWLQQFDRHGIDEIISTFAGDVRDVAYFKYESGGWIRSTAQECADCEYFDINAGNGFDADYAAAARAVACLELCKPQ